MFNFIRVLSLVQGSGWEFLCFLLHTIRLQVRERRRGWRSPTAEYGVDGKATPTWPVVRARKPNSLALPAGVREPNQSAGCFSASFRSKVRARKPNSLALPAGVREPNQSAAPVLARSDEGTRACGVQCANREGRAPGKRRRGWRGRRRNKGLRGARRQHERPRAGGWRGPTVEHGLAGCKAPTWKASLREKGAGVGAVRRRNKGLWGARRQHGSPRAGKKAPKLAWPDGGTRACGVQGANMPGHARPESE